MRGKEFLLIGTKLNRPDIGNRSIVRPRLISRLNEGLDKRITLISAPAGFGKTTSQSNGSLQAPCVQHGCRWRVTTASRSVSLGMSLPPSGLLSRSSWKSLGLLSAVQLPPPEYLADVMISEVGALADLLLIDGNLLENIYLIAEPEKNFSVIMKDRKIYKNMVK